MKFKDYKTKVLGGVIFSKDIWLVSAELTDTFRHARNWILAWEVEKIKDWNYIARVTPKDRFALFNFDNNVKLFTQSSRPAQAMFVEPNLLTDQNEFYIVKIDGGIEIVDVSEFNVLFEEV